MGDRKMTNGTHETLGNLTEACPSYGQMFQGVCQGIDLRWLDVLLLSKQRSSYCVEPGRVLVGSHDSRLFVPEFRQ